MNITREKTDELNSILRIVIEKEDYEEKVTNSLKEYRRKARIDGFRPGKVPFGLINKMYRKPVLVEEVNKILNESLSKYIIDEKLQILGEPLPNETYQKSFDWDNDTSFEFVVDLGLAPDFDMDVTSKDKLISYKLKIDDKIRSKYIDNFTSRLGSFNEIDTANDKSMVKADIFQVDDEGQIVDGGIAVEDGRVSLELIKDEKILKKFIGLKKDDEIIVNLKKAFPNNVDLAGLLKIKSEEIDLINGEFKLKVKSISIFRKAEINQEFYDNLFGKDEVKTTEEFNARIDEIIKSEFGRDAEYKIRLDIRNHFIGRFKKDLPGEFLKRWILQSNKEKFTIEQIEKDFDHFIEDWKWQLIKNKIAMDNSIKVTEEELLEYAKIYTRMQFSQYYGSIDFPDEYIINFAQDMLKKDEERRKLADRKYEDKIFEFVKMTAKVEEKEISSEKFNKLLEK